MLMYNKNMGINRGEELKGFTIIEVMLFLALSGFLMVGILAGTGSSIANQRYKDAVQDAAEALRKAYSFVSDTQVSERNAEDGICNTTISDENPKSKGDSGRGRTNCAVYGAVVTIYKDRIQTTSLIGKDYHDYVRLLNSKTAYDSATEEERALLNNTDIDDITLLGALKANNLAYHCDGANSSDCHVAVAGSVQTRKLKWDTLLKQPNKGDEKNKDLSITLIIYRSPITGAIRTVVMDKAISDGSDAVIDYDSLPSDSTNPADYGVYGYIAGKKTEKFVQKDVYFCVDSNGMDSYADHNRVIHIVKNAHSQTGIVIEDMDAVIKDKDGNEISCDK